MTHCRCASCEGPDARSAEGAFTVVRSCDMPAAVYRTGPFDTQGTVITI